MKQSITLFCIALLTMFISNSYAYPGGSNKSPGGHLSRFINQFDINGDKTVTKEEFSLAMQQRFKKMDTDGNGTVSQKEFTQHAKARQQEHQNRHKTKMDSNNDGVISKQEYLEAKRIKAEKNFAALDKDNNGSLTDEEFKSEKSRFKKSTHYFPKIDRNGDGMISPEESKASSTRLFERLDQNEDQVITQDEIKAMSLRHKKRS